MKTSHLSVRLFFSTLIIYAFAAVPVTPQATADGSTDPFIIAGPVRFFTNPDPDGHRLFITAIQKAQKSIAMTMYHLSDPNVVAALKEAHARGVQIGIILDGSSMKSEPPLNTIYNDLVASGISVRLSTPLFSITHVKAMVIDSSYAFITSINLTLSYANSRDYGLITADPSIINEMQSVFSADWENAANGTGITPPVNNVHLVWSPVNSESRLTTLVNHAQNNVILTVENLGDPVFMSALASAAQRGVSVRVIVPMCDKNPNPLYNYPLLAKLAAAGVITHVMPSPSTPAVPYMHGKMITVDGHVSYIGSVNFSINSMEHARELGVVLSNADVVTSIEKVFEQDWAASVSSSLPPHKCPAMN